jgi:DNA-binding SARP family transcriptional activator
MGVTVRLLGPVEVVQDGVRLPVRDGQEQAVVARLGLDARRAVSVAEVSAAVWEEPPASAEASVRVLVSRLRKAWLAEGVDVLRTTPSGYSLDVPEVDASIFQSLVQRGRAELSQRRFAPAAATLRQALDLWRGQPFGGAGTPALYPAAAQLTEVHLSAAESLLEASLELGQFAQVAAESERLCRAHPLREGLWAFRMRALYGAGRQADALAAYRELRDLLRDELGIDPSPAVRELEQSILAQDPRLTASGVSAGPAVVALPDPLRAAERFPLVGRDREIAAAVRAWDSVCAGGSGLLLVTGAPGIGKTRLAREIARLVYGRAGVVLYGRCDEDLAVPYRPFIESLTHLVTHVSDAAVDGPSGALLARLTHPGMEAEPAAAWDVGRFLLFGAVESALRAATRRKPVLLVVDDLQWADRSSQLLLAHLAGALIPGLLILATCRDQEHELSDAIAALTRTATATRTALAPFDTAQTASLISFAHPTGGRGTEAAAAQLQRLTGGNPFFVTETVQHLSDRGLLAKGLDPDNLGPPDSVRDIVRARVNRLGPATAELLATAAAVGAEFNLAVLGGVAGLPAERLLALLESAERAGLVADSGGYRRRFAHALVAQTLYADLTPSRRTLLHARTAEAMTAAGTCEPGEIAFHYLAGMTPDNVESAVGAATAAGDHALGALAPDEAVRWYTAALLALPPPRDDERHARAMLNLGIAQRQAGLPEHRDTLLSAARMARAAHTDDVLIGSALAAHRGGFASLGQVDTERLALFDAALATAEPASVAKVRLLAIKACELTWEPDAQRRLDAVHAAVAAARAFGEPAQMLFAIAQTITAQWIPDTTRERLALLTEARGIADSAGDRPAQAHVRQLLSAMLLENAQGADAAAALAEAAQMSARAPEPFARYVGAFLGGCGALARGDLARAEADAGLALATGQALGQPDAQHWYEEQMFFIRWAQGRLTEVLGGHRMIAAELPLVTSRAAELAYAEATAGDRARARTLLDSLSQAKFVTFYGPPWLGTTCLWADAAVAVHDRAAAAALYRMLRPWAHLFATAGPVPVHAVAYSLGVLAGFLGKPAAAGHLHDALDVHDKAETPFGSALTHLVLSELDAKDSGSAPARHARAALDIAHEHGFEAIRARAAELLKP